MAATTSSLLSSSLSPLSNNLQLCRICISSAAATNANNSNSSTQMISIFGEDSLWKKIATLADVKIERDDTLPQQVCITCAKNTISACLFKKKCEDADNFFRQQLLIRKIESKSDQKCIVESEDDNELDNDIQNGRNHGDTSNKSEEEHEEDEHFQSYKQQQPLQMNGGGGGGGGVDILANGNNESHHEPVDDDDDDDHDVVEDDGEIKCANGQKPAFDFNSIRLMHEYMQQHLSKLNGIQGHGASDDDGAMGTASDTEQDDDDEDGPLPLIPEIELITPSEDGGGAGASLTNGTPSLMEGTTAGITQMRAYQYQCPHCFQVFELKQVLKAHMQSVHGTSGPVYECTNCKKTYFYKRFLEKHVRRGRCVKKRRNQTRPMQCSDCNVLFPTGHHLGWHKRTGCPSKTAKMPLQQLFKQNIVQYNNFPRRIGIRKPENAIYLHNRKIIMANNKRKGRTRIKLDAKKIALAKQLILREATTTVIANELNISRTFAWRLRKSLVNGVSLHERVIDPPEDEEEDNVNNESQVPDMVDEALPHVENRENQLKHQPFTELIKRERPTTEDEDEADNANNPESDEEDQQQYHSHQQSNLEKNHLAQQLLRQNNNNVSVATSVIQRTNELKLNNAPQEGHQQQITSTTNAILQQHKLHNKISVVQQQRLMEINRNAHLENNHTTATDSDSENDEVESNHHRQDYQRHYQQPHEQQQQQSHQETENVNSQQQIQQTALYLQKSTTAKNPEDAHTNPVAGNAGSDGKVSLITQLSPAVAAAIHQLPVNLSIRPIASMQNSETVTNNVSGSKKKPRKPNVFIDDEKYAMAKMLVAQNSSTMEIAKALNVSQMTAWKLRDAIIKGIPLSYRNRRDIRMTMMRHDEDAGSVVSESSDTRRETDTERQQQTLLVQQQLDHQQKLQQQHLQQQQQIQQLLQRQQQLQQQQQQLELQKQQRQQEREREQQQQQQQQQQQLLQQKQQQQQKKQQLQVQQKRQQILPAEQKHTNPRRRLKAAEREVRDKEITREILELIKEDNNIQYWKVSARLAEKGYAISPSSVCQKLKSMGIHRRWKPGDKPPLIDMEQLKGGSTNNNMAALATAAANAQNASSSADEGYEQQFDMAGAHFLSAFTR